MTFLFKETSYFFSCFIYLMISLLGIASVSNAQSVSFRLFGPKEGFYPDRVKEIVQDKDGFIWLATNEGLIKYDGHTFRAIQEEESLSPKGTDILCLLPVDNGDIWIGTNKGLALYQREFNKYIQVKFPNQEDSYVISLAKDNKGQIWLGTGQGIFFVKNMEAVPLFKSNKFHETLPFIKATKKGTLLFITHNMIYQYDPAKSIFIDSLQYTNEKVLSDNFHTAVEIDQQNNLWIGKYNGELYYYQLGKRVLKKFDLKLIANNKSAIINNIYCKDSSKIWVSIDESGLYYFDTQLQKFVPNIVAANSNLASYKINAIFIDQEGSFWLGIDRNGLALTNKFLNRFKQIIPPKTAVNHIVSAICKDHFGNLWIGTDGSGIYVYNSSLKLIKSFVTDISNSSGLSNDAVLSIFEDSKQRIWIGTFRGGLSLYLPSTNSFKHYQFNGQSTGPLRNDIRSIDEDAEGNLWLAVHGKGVAKFNPKTQTFTNYTHLQSPWTTKVLVDVKGTVWATSNSGISYLALNQIDFTDIVTEHQFNSLQDHDVNCLYQDKDNTIWVGTVNGLYYIDQNKLIKAKNTNQLGKASIKSIEQAQTGDFFISTNRGLYRYQKTKGECGWYGLSDGIPGEDFIINASFITNQNLYFGTSSGLCWFDTQQLPEETIDNTPCITEIRLFNKPFLQHKNILTLGEMSLSHQKNHLTLFLSSLTYKLGNEKIDVEYKMEGLEDDWQILGKNNSVSYPAIPPGNYTFFARNTLLGTQLRGPIYSFKIYISPPFWQTWWFRSAIFIIFVLGVYFYFKFKTWRIQLRNKILEEKIKLRTTEIMSQKDLLEKQKRELEVANNTKNTLFSIIAHDLRAPFSSIAGLAQLLANPQIVRAQEEQLEMTNYIYQASKNALNIVENLLDWARTQTSRIQFTPIEIDLNATIIKIINQFEFTLKEKQIATTYSASASLRVHVDQDMFETIIRNLLVNAIKFTQSEGYIMIDVQYNSSGFNITIRDNGIGMTEDQINIISQNSFHRSALGTKGEKGTGLGLELIKEFLKYHQASWSVSSQPGQGSEFKLNFKDDIKIDNAEEYSLEFKPILKTPFNNTNKSVETVIYESQFDGIEGSLILIVDDQDEVRKSIVYSLKSHFEIMEAENGSKALALAKSNMPDLIVSDVVMPDMDGFFMSKQLKEDLDTSHIPIILLTSQNEESSIISGLKTGIDDYMLKPFNPQILALKVCNLLQNRELLKKKVSIDEEYLLKPISDNSLDKIWLAKIHNTIEENLADEDFGVEQLSKTMNMHRSNFSKKLTALTGQPPTDLIRIQRMKRAAKLIIASGKNISEIAFAVGFSDPKYFSKTFKSYYGILPSEYGK